MTPEDTLKDLKAEAYDALEQVAIWQQKVAEINQKIAALKHALAQTQE